MADETFGDRLKRLREARGLSFYRIERDGIVNHSTVHRIESGQRFPSYAMVGRLADLLGLAPGSADRDRLYLSAGFIPPGVPTERLLLTCQMARRNGKGGRR